MDHPLLSFDDRLALGRNGWFASLSSSLRHDILRRGTARQLRDGDCVFERGRPATHWCAVVRGAVRVGLTSAGGQKLTLCFMRPGSWFCALTVLQSAEADYDAHARGSTTLLMLAQADLRSILQQHGELHAALLRLHARRTRQVFGLIEDMMSLPLRARLAKHLAQLGASHGVPVAGGIRIGLPLTQEDMAQLVGASRQRVNCELMALRREGVLKTDRGEVLVCDAAALQRIAGGGEAVAAGECQPDPPPAFLPRRPVRAVPPELLAA